MTTTEALLVLGLGLTLWIAVGYQVIRRAVCAGILDADRRKEQAAAERELVKRQMEQL